MSNIEKIEPMDHLFIVNPGSFFKKAQMDRTVSDIKSYFEGKSESNFSIHISRFPRDAVIVIRKYLMQTLPETRVRVYAVGGDGILFDCLNGMVGWDNAELASMPCGKKKSNDFIRAFGDKNVDLFKSLELQTTAPTIPIDLIYYGNNYSINLCSVGMESASMIQMADIQGRFRKWLTLFPSFYPLLFIIGGIISLFDQKLLYQYYEVDIDGEDYSGHYASINISNGPCCGGDKCIIPIAIPDDGLLDMLLYKSSGTLRMLLNINRYVHGKSRAKDIILKRGRRISIRSLEPLRINMDGEVFFDTNISVEVVPGKVQFVAVQNLPVGGGGGGGKIQRNFRLTKHRASKRYTVIASISSSVETNSSSRRILPRSLRIV
jgi:diacylglycerol kinase family enzyme